MSWFTYCRLILAVLLFPSLVVFSCDSPDSEITDTPRIYKEDMYVSAGGGLRMRSAPNTDASRITTIPDREKVQVIEEKGNKITLAGKEGKWVKVSYDDQEGWVFGGYLVENVTSKNLPGQITCMGKFKSIGYCSVPELKVFKNTVHLAGEFVEYNKEVKTDQGCIINGILVADSLGPNFDPSVKLTISFITANKAKIKALGWNPFNCEYEFAAEKVVE